MFCPCCAGRTVSSIHDLDESGSCDGDRCCLASGEFETHRNLEPCTPCISGDLLGVPLAVATDLPAEFTRHTLPDLIYCTRIQRHAIWGYLSCNQICQTYAERLLLENDRKLLDLYLVVEALGELEEAGSCESPASHDHYLHTDHWGQDDVGQREAVFG